MLEYTDAVLSQFDFVVASVHAAFDQPRDEITARGGPTFVANAGLLVSQDCSG